MSAVNVNVCPGFRNFGNTCWLNACLQCIMQTSALRAHFLREESGMSALDVAVKRVCTCYWALARTPRHSVIAPVDVLTALILQWPQLGGALQQDVSEVLQCFHLASVAGLELPADGLAVSVDGIVLAQLKNETLQKDMLTLQALWDCIGVGWKDVSTFPACLIVSFPTVYELPDGGYRYSRLALTDVDVPIQVVGKNPATYSFRAYVQHKHHGEPSSTSRVAGHYVAHFQNAHVWYTADDTATTLKRQQGHALPAAAFFELVRENVSDDWALVDPGAMHREPTWLQSALGVFSALQMDAEWLLGLSEENQTRVARVASATEMNATGDETVTDDLYHLLIGGSRGTERGQFQLLEVESEVWTDSEMTADLSDSSSPRPPLEDEAARTVGKLSPSKQLSSMASVTETPRKSTLDKFFGPSQMKVSEPLGGLSQLSLIHI